MKKFLSYAALTLVFIGTLFVYGRYVFNGATWLLEQLWHDEFHWEDAPLLDLILRMGVGGALAWILTIGLRNRFRKRPLLDGIHWQKLLVVVFCLSLLSHLNNEVDDLLPRLAAIEVDTDYGSHNPLGWFTTPILIAVYFIGKGLWPNPTYWECRKCNGINLWEMRKCTTEGCAGYRRGPKLDESKAEAIHENRQQSPASDAGKAAADGGLTGAPEG